MPVNVRLVKKFLDNVVKKNPEEGLILNEVAKLYDEVNVRRASDEKALPVSFYPMIELYCVCQDPRARMQTSGSQRKIRGFSFKTDDIRRLVSIFVNGNGATPENLPTINKLFRPLLVALAENPEFEESAEDSDESTDSDGSTDSDKNL